MCVYTPALFRGLKERIASLMAKEALEYAKKKI